MKRASLKGKENKEEVKDVESRGFLMNLVEDTLAVLGLPHWGVAESLLDVVATHFSNLAFPNMNDPQGFPKANVQAVSATHKSMLIDVVLLAYTGCFKYIQRAQDLALEVDLYSLASLPSNSFLLLLEEQQQEFCNKVAEFSSDVSIAAPIRLARSQEGAKGTVFHERARQVCALTTFMPRFRVLLPTSGSDKRRVVDLCTPFAASFYAFCRFSSISCRPRTILLAKVQSVATLLPFTLCAGAASNLNKESRKTTKKPRRQPRKASFSGVRN